MEKPPLSFSFSSAPVRNNEPGTQRDLQTIRSNFPPLLERHPVGEVDAKGKPAAIPRASSAVAL